MVYDILSTLIYYTIPLKRAVIKPIYNLDTTADGCIFSSDGFQKKKKLENKSISTRKERRVRKSWFSFKATDRDRMISRFAVLFCCLCCLRRFRLSKNRWEKGERVLTRRIELDFVVVLFHFWSFIFIPITSLGCSGWSVPTVTADTRPACQPASQPATSRRSWYAWRQRGDDLGV